VHHLPMLVHNVIFLEFGKPAILAGFLFYSIY